MSGRVRDQSREGERGNWYDMDKKIKVAIGKAREGGKVGGSTARTQESRASSIKRETKGQSSSSPVTPSKAEVQRNQSNKKPLHAAKRSRSKSKPNRSAIKISREKFRFSSFPSIFKGRRKHARYLKT
jgi:hypothetical protein